MESTSVSPSVVSSLALARRRRQARLRQSLREADKAESLDSEDKWLSLPERNRMLCHTGFGLVSKRREANARERLRVKNLNSGFAKLRRILPTVPPNRKPSKVDTLQGAIDYIYQLERVLEATGGIPNIKKNLSAGGHSHSRQSVTERPFIEDPAKDDAQAAMFRYAPPFNRFENASVRYCTESVPLPTGLPYRSENDLGLSYLTRPQVYIDGRVTYCNNSNGYPSPTSSVTSDDSTVYSTGYLDLSSDRETRPNPSPPAYSSQLPSRSSTFDKSSFFRRREPNPSGWGSDDGRNPTNDVQCVDVGQVKYTIGRGLGSEDDDPATLPSHPISVGGYTALPPVSSLYATT